MKVLRIIAGMDARIGGPPESARASAVAVQRRGAEVTFVTAVARETDSALQSVLDGMRAEGIEVLTFPYSHLAGRDSSRWGISIGLLRWLAANCRRFDIVHCHAAWVLGTVAGLILARLARRPTVLTPHESLTSFDIGQTRRSITKLGKRLLKPLILGASDLIVMASALEARDSVAPGSAAAARCRVIPHPVLDERGPKAPTRTGPSTPGALRLGFLGRLHPKKNLDVLIRALAHLPETVTLTVAGDGPDALVATMQTLAGETGVDDRITWLGFVSGDTKESFFESIDVLAIPSEYECFGMAAAEAMVRGVPVLVTTETGIAAIVQSHGAGAIAAPTPDAIAAAVTPLAEDASRLAALSRGALAAAEQALSLAAHGAALYREYEALLSRQTAPSQSRSSDVRP